ncbi:MAG: LysM peptidoglycan-binding domain-containing protein [Cyclobacteriaceae bacterium]|nr:LysM peptidoglycan-binding domain-containing protein [Cyclobacteriaceae bacterium]
MLRTLLTIVGLALCELVYSQSSVQVPSRMTFAGVKLKITEKGREAIQEEVDKITRSPKYFNAKVVKADIHFPLIEQAFIEEGVSTDFKYLSLQESALIPDAVSTSNAVGYWQFKDFTAIQMGLRVDKFIDERMNIYASSRAAARYMKKNNEYFDNWLFALQAYQMGAGAALEVIDEKKYGTNSITITEKTYWYVRTFLAHKIAYEGVIGKKTPSPELVVYKSGKGKTLSEIAKETNLDLEELELYNKWLRKGKIPSDKQYAVILPSGRLTKLDLVSSTERSTNNIVRKMPDFDMVQSNKFPEIDKNRRYVSHPNWLKINGIPGVLATEREAISDLAAKGNLDIGKFLKFNDISIDHHVKKGQVYYFKRKHSKAGLYYHVVQENEKLWSISQKYGIRLNTLLTKNRIRKIENIKQGRVLWLRHIRPANVPIEYREVKKKSAMLVVDLPLNIKSKETQNSVEENGNEQDNLLKNPSFKQDSTKNSSKNIEIKNTDPIEVTSPPEFKKTIIVKHEVKAGETLYGISRMYNVNVMDVVKWNELNLTEDINAGQFLMVHTTINDNAQAISDEGDMSTGNEELKYVVKTGDTMYKIAREYDVLISDLLQWNNKIDHNVSVGEELIIKEKKKGK